MSRLRRIVPRLLFSCLLFWGFLELALVLFANFLPLSIANAVFSAYRSPGGIYVRDRVSDVVLMRPNETCTNFYNGFWWEHQTDPHGFRNPPGTEPKVLLIGDSMIYGHGTEIEDNVSYVLKHEYGWKAYNMGQQGTTIDSQYALLRLHIEEFRPDKVYLFPLVNDFSDLYLSNPGKGLAHPKALDHDYSQVKERAYNRPPNLREVVHRNRTFRLFQKLSHSGLQRPRSTVWKDCLLKDDLFNEIAPSYRKVLSAMVDLCREHGAELEVVFLYTHGEGEDWVQTQSRFNDYLADLCRDLELPYHDTQPIFFGKREYFLPDDYHFSPAGFRKLAEFMVEASGPR